MKKLLLAPLILVSAAGGLFGTYVYWDSTFSPKAKLISALKADLNDPYTAKIGDHYYFKKSGALCGTVNAKNKFGAYVGDTTFIVEKSGTVTYDPRQAELNSEDLALQIKQAKEALVFMKLLYANCPDDAA